MDDIAKAVSEAVTSVLSKSKRRPPDPDTESSSEEFQTPIRPTAAKKRNRGKKEKYVTRSVHKKL